MKFTRTTALCALFAILTFVQGCAVCADAQPENQPFHGTLIIKGNDPFMYPVLIQEDGSQWTLKNINLEAAMAMQNKPVTGYGSAARKTIAGQLPELNVRTIGIER